MGGSASTLRLQEDVQAEGALHASSTWRGALASSGCVSTGERRTNTLSSAATNAFAAFEASQANDRPRAGT